MPRTFSNILVTGGAGFIGSHIVNRLLIDDFEVTVIDNLTTGRLENIDYPKKQNFHFIEGDIRDFDLIKEVVKDIDAVFHEAALVNVVSSFKDPLITHDVNVKGTLNLLKNCLDSNVKRFIFASSAAVYGETDVLPIREEIMLKPMSPYAVSKLSAESYAHLFFKAYGLETVSLRYFNVYGPKQEHVPFSGVIPTFINRALSEQPPVIHGTGEQTRDFVNVKDVVDANLLALRSKNAVGEAFNIGSGTPTPINQLAETILKMFGKESLSPIHMDSVNFDIPASYADISKARKVLGYNPKITLKEGITQLVYWYSSASKQ